MHILKPLDTGVLTRTVHWGRQPMLAVGIHRAFHLLPPREPVPDYALWQAVTETLGKSMLFDEGWPKPSAEFLVAGSAHAPGGVPVDSLLVRAEVAGRGKDLLVHGARFWLETQTAPTKAVPFTTQPLGPENAYGGDDWPDNPLGMGRSPIRNDQGVHVIPLPHVEAPATPLSRKSDIPPHAGFGSLSPAHSLRAKHAGTYDTEWMRTQFPGLAPDTKPPFHFLAPPDQRLEGYLQGGEPFFLGNLHPEHPEIKGHLPAERMRCFLFGAGDRFLELALRADTVWFFPDRNLGVCIHHAMLETSSETVPEWEQVLAGYESPDAPPRPASHYQAVRARACDPLQRFSALRIERSLIPDNTLPPLLAMEADPEGRQAEWAELEAEAGGESVLQWPEAWRGQTAAGGGSDAAVNGEPHATPVEAQGVDSNTPHAALDTDPRQMAFDRFAAQDELEKALAEAGFTLPSDAPTLDGARATLRDAGALDDAAETLLASLAPLEERIRALGHGETPPETPTPDVAAARRAQAEASLQTGASLAQADLSGADLTGLDFSGADLRGACLAGASAKGVAFDGADLSNADLSHADLRGGTFTATMMEGANLSAAHLDGADMTGCDARGTRCHGTVMHGALLERAIFFQADIHHADLRDTKAANADFAGINATECRFDRMHAPGIRLEAGLFDTCTGVSADFTRADAERITLLTTVLDGSDWSGARLGGSLSGMQTTFEGACLRGARIPDAEWSGTTLAGADASGSDWSRTTCNEVEGRGLKLSRADAAGSIWNGSDLRNLKATACNFMDASLRGCNLHGARLADTNLYGADLQTADLTDIDTTGAVVADTVIPLYRKGILA